MPPPLLLKCTLIFCLLVMEQGLSAADYQAQKEERAQHIIERLDVVFPGLKDNVVYLEVSPWLGCQEGSEHFPHEQSNDWQGAVTLGLFIGRHSPEK